MLAPYLNSFTFLNSHFYLVSYEKQCINFCLFDLILYIHQQSFSYIGTGLPGLNQYLARINALAQGHNAVTLVRLEPAALWSRVKHSTTEPPMYQRCIT